MLHLLLAFLCYVVVIISFQLNDFCKKKNCLCCLLLQASGFYLHYSLTEGNHGPAGTLFMGGGGACYLEGVNDPLS